jgi:hypothetical protein
VGVQKVPSLRLLGNIKKRETPLLGQKKNLLHLTLLRVVKRPNLTHKLGEVKCEKKGAIPPPGIRTAPRAKRNPSRKKQERRLLSRLTH